MTQSFHVCAFCRGKNGEIKAATEPERVQALDLSLRRSVALFNLKWPKLPVTVLQDDLLDICRGHGYADATVTGDLLPEAGGGVLTVREEPDGRVLSLIKGASYLSLRDLKD